MNYFNAFNANLLYFALFIIHYLTDHEVIRLSLESPVTETKPLIQNLELLEKQTMTQYTSILLKRSSRQFVTPTSTKMSEKFTRYLDPIFDLYVPKRTRPRQTLPSCCTSNLINKLRTQKPLFENKPTSYRKQIFFKLENQITDSHDKKLNRETAQRTHF